VSAISKGVAANNVGVHCGSAEIIPAAPVGFPCIHRGESVLVVTE